MKNKVIIGLLALLMAGSTSCRKLYEWNQPKDPEIEYSAVWPLSGEWYVTYTFDDGTGNIGDHYGVGYTTLLTYNTANEDKDLFWISDVGNFWIFTIKSPCNVPARTFAGTDLVSTADYSGSLYDIKVQISNGKVIEDGGLSTSGVVCDSIYFEIEFEDDPGTIYYCSGVRRTGFLEDEH
jgi:hypothetical protein